jgi:hypothetical protein
MDRDILYIPENTLYCSEDCLLEDYPDALIGIDTQEVHLTDFNQNYEDNIGTGNHWGAICPACSMEYHCF